MTTDGSHPSGRVRLQDKPLSPFWFLFLIPRELGLVSVCLFSVCPCLVSAFHHESGDKFYPSGSSPIPFQGVQSYSRRPEPDNQTRKTNHLLQEGMTFIVGWPETGEPSISPGSIMPDIVYKTPRHPDQILHINAWQCMMERPPSWLKFFLLLPPTIPIKELEPPKDQKPPGLLLLALEDLNPPPYVSAPPVPVRQWRQQPRTQGR